MRLTGKVAMVTGGGSGIGRAIVLALAREGADILILDIQMANAEAVVREVQALGRTSIAQRVDVSNEAEIQTFIRDGIRAFGQIDILVNNAGVNPGLGLPFTRQVEADWDKVFEVNVKSVFFMCKTIAPHFMERHAGKIINIASIAGPLSSTTMPPYIVSKMGIIPFTKIVAKDLAPYNVNVNAICPGLLYTDMWKKIGEVIRETNPAYADLTPPADVREACGGVDSAEARADTRGHRTRGHLLGLGGGPEHRRPGPDGGWGRGDVDRWFGVLRRTLSDATKKFREKY